MLVVRTADVSIFLTAKSRSQMYQQICSSGTGIFSPGYDIKKDLESVSPLPTIPSQSDSLFHMTRVGERSKRLQDGTTKKGTQELFRELVEACMESLSA